MTSSELRFIPFASRRDKGWNEAWKLYESSFPACERWDEAAYDRAFADPAFTADGVWLDGEFVGLLFHWTHDALSLIHI